MDDLFRFVFIVIAAFNVVMFCLILYRQGKIDAMREELRRRDR